MKDQLSVQSSLMEKLKLETNHEFENNIYLLLKD
jgi:hypothetical protein